MSNTQAQSKELEAICSSIEAAELLGLTRQRINVFCKEGRIAAKLLGRDYAISRASLEAFAELERGKGGATIKQPTKTRAKQRPKKNLRKNRRRGR